MTQSPFTVDPLHTRIPAQDIDWTSTTYELPPLPYPSDALQGFLPPEILEIHHDKHHRKYVDGLNRTLESLAHARRQDDFEHVQALTRALAFHGSGHVLHTLYWHSMSPSGGGEPHGDLRTAIEAGFGTLGQFRRHFVAAAEEVEASGWGLLVYEPVGRRLVVTGAESHQQMAFQGSIPLLACDVWEHAYYLKFHNDRAAYVEGFMDVIHWDFVAQRLAWAASRA